MGIARIYRGGVRVDFPRRRVRSGTSAHEYTKITLFFSINKFRLYFFLEKTESHLGRP